MYQSSNQQPSRISDNAGPSQGQDLLADLALLRSKVATAWQERGVTLTSQEQKQLRDEIKSTCTFLTDLTVSS